MSRVRLGNVVVDLKEAHFRFALLHGTIACEGDKFVHIKDKCDPDQMEGTRWAVEEANAGRTPEFRALVKRVREDWLI